MMVVCMVFSFLAAIYSAIQDHGILGNQHELKDSLHFLTILINTVFSCPVA